MKESMDKLKESTCVWGSLSVSLLHLTSHLSQTTKLKIIILRISLLGLYRTLYVPTGVSGPSFNLTTISDWPSIRNRGGLLAVTAWTTSSNQIHPVHAGFNRTLAGLRVARATSRILDHLAHLALFSDGTMRIFLAFSSHGFTVGRCGACGTGEVKVLSPHAADFLNDYSGLRADEVACTCKETGVSSLLFCYIWKAPDRR